MIERADVRCLTPLEQDIVDLVAQGFRDSHLAESFWMTRKLLQAHLLSIFEKLGVSNETELAELARRRQVARPGI